MNNLPKVLFLIPSVSSGGIETYLLRFLTYKKKEINAFILVRGSNKGDLANEYRELNVPMGFMPLGYFNPLNWVKYYRFYRKNDFDVVCDFNSNFAGIPLLIAKIAGIKKRIAFYRQGKDHFNPSLVKKSYNYIVNRLVYYNATHILSNSKAAISSFFPYRKQSDLRFQVIYNGVNTEMLKSSSEGEVIRKELNIPNTAYVVGHSGRLDKAKNHETILNVLQNVIKENPDVYLILCGRNTEKLIDRVKSLGIENNVRLLGYRSDVLSVLKSFDLYFFPSYTEGQPNALIEAILSEIPIVASNIAPILEIIPKEYHEFLKDAEDSAGFTDLILKIKSKQMKQNTEGLKNWAEKKFNAQDNFSKFMEIIFYKSNL